MNRNFVAAVLALAVWLIASQHCNLEAAGLWADPGESGGDSGCCGTLGGNCDSDGCEVVESGYYSPQKDFLQQAPEFTPCQGLTCICIVAPAAEAAVRLIGEDGFQRPLDWVPTWQFAQRAALPPGAPSRFV